MTLQRFNHTTFLTSASRLSECPADTGMEIAFAGRSNVGKSSVINSITANSRLARISKTPGRTQLLNFFQVSDTLRLVDLPGYGYAKVPEKIRQHWGAELQKYFSKRQSLRGLVLVMDIRHPLKDSDMQMLEWCKSASLPVHVVLNKSDKLSRGAVSSTLAKVKRNPLMQDNSAQSLSTLKGLGVEELQKKMGSWFATEGSGST